MNIWTVKLLGRFQLKDSVKGIQVFLDQDATKLLTYLLYFHQRPHGCDQLANMLWPQLDLEQRKQVFQASLTSLQTVLTTTEGPVIQCQDNQLKLDIRYFSIDLLHIRKLIQQVNACTEPQQQLHYLKEIVQRDYGTLLNQFEENWIVLERRRWHALYIATLHQLVESCLQLKKLSAATAYAHLAVNTEPHSEQTHLDLIKTYVARGYHSSAQRQYSELTRIFNQDLKRSVSKVTDELMKKLGLCQATLTVL